MWRKTIEGATTVFQEGAEIVVTPPRGNPDRLERTLHQFIFSSSKLKTTTSVEYSSSVHYPSDAENGATGILEQIKLVRTAVERLRWQVVSSATYRRVSFDCPADEKHTVLVYGEGKVIDKISRVSVTCVEAERTEVIARSFTDVAGAMILDLSVLLTEAEFAKLFASMFSDAEAAEATVVACIPCFQNRAEAALSEPWHHQTVYMEEGVGISSELKAIYFHRTAKVG